MESSKVRMGLNDKTHVHHDLLSLFVGARNKRELRIHGFPFAFGNRMVCDIREAV